MRLYLIVALICISVMVCDVENFLKSVHMDELTKYSVTAKEGTLLIEMFVFRIWNQGNTCFM